MNLACFIMNRRKACCKNVKNREWLFFLISRSPMGLLTGKYRAGKKLPEGSRAAEGFGPKIFSETNLQIVEELIEFAGSRNHTILELAFGWLLSHKPVASVIA